MNKHDYTDWFSYSTQPGRRGLYQTSRDIVVSGKNIKDLGNGYAFWDGEKWCDYNRWANHMRMGLYDAVWRGLVSSKATKKYKRLHGIIL